MKPIFLPPAAALNVGAAPAPLLVKTWSALPAATAAITPDASQVISSPSVPSANFAIPIALSAMAVAFPDEVTTPVRFALVVTVPAVRLDAVPDALVATKAEGVPRAGVTRVGLVANTAPPVPVSSVRAERRLALDGVPRNVATLEPRLVIPVPPLPTGSVPVTPEVRVTCAHAGTLDVPVLVKTLVEFVSFANRAGVFAPEA